jgi:hypothetical protein
MVVGASTIFTILFGLFFRFLAVAQGQLLFQSPFLLVVGLAMLGGFAVLCKIYFFSVSPALRYRESDSRRVNEFNVSNLTAYRWPTTWRVVLPMNYSSGAIFSAASFEVITGCTSKSTRSLQFAIQ